MNRHEEIEARLSAIAGEIDADGADIDALTKEVRALKQEKKEIEERAEKRAKLRQEVENGGGEDIKRFAAPERREERAMGADSKEYRSAFLTTTGPQSTETSRSAASVSRAKRFAQPSSSRKRSLVMTGSSPSA